MEVLPSVSSMKGPCNGVILDSHISHHISAGGSGVTICGEDGLSYCGTLDFSRCLQRKWNERVPISAGWGFERCGVFRCWQVSKSWIDVSKKRVRGPSPAQKMVADSKLIFCPQNQQKSPLKDQSSMLKRKGNDFVGCGLQTEMVQKRLWHLLYWSNVWIPEFTGWCILMGCLFLSLRVGFFHRDFSIWQRLETRVTIWTLGKTHVPGGSKWPFYPLVGGHLTFERVT